MKRSVVLALLLLCPPAALPAQSVKLPATLGVPQPGWVVIAPDALDGDSVAYFSLDPGLQALPPQVSLSDKTMGVFTALGTGTFRVRAVASKVVGGKAVISPVAECVVTVGAPGPPPPPPGPPPPPAPTDPFSQAVAAAYAQEKDPARAQQVAFLAAVYQAAPAFLTAGQTNGGLFTQLSTAIHAPGVGLPKGALPLVEKVIGDDLSVTLGTSATAPVDSVKARAAFARYSAALGGLK